MASLRAPDTGSALGGGSVVVSGHALGSTAGGLGNPTGGSGVLDRRRRRGGVLVRNRILLRVTGGATAAGAAGCVEGFSRLLFTCPP